MKKLVQTIIALGLTLVLSLTIMLPAYAASSSEAESKATALKQLGLFQGVSENDFALGRAPSRVEALVMLIRTLGKAAEAEQNGGKHPFTDVPAWADKYIGYAYEKGLTKGTSATTFGVGDANADMYLTFMLRALGYSDTTGDFTYNATKLLAKTVGILPDVIDTEKFLRSDVVLVSWVALEADVKGGSQSLVEKLISEKVFSTDDYTKAVQSVNEQEPAAVTVASFDALKAALNNPAAKAISIQSPGNPVIVTGELTIPNGVSVTVERGNDFYIEGSLTNNGTINIMGSDTILSAEFINYSVMSVQKSGKVTNNGAINLLPSVLSDTSDHGPVGGQLRVFDGSFENNGSVFLKAGVVNTHGGMLVVAGGPFTNSGIVIVDGFQTIITNTFTNGKGAVVINNTYVGIRDSGVFTNFGTLSGNSTVKE